MKALARRHRWTSISLFGSVARGEETDDCDADFLVHFEPGSSLFDLLHLQDGLQELLRCAIDVVSVGRQVSRAADGRRSARMSRRSGLPCRPYIGPHALAVALAWVRPRPATDTT